jgi:adenylate kinase
MRVSPEDAKERKRLGAIRLVLLGPPGAGKGTQAKFLHDRFEACQVSTGDILRKAVAEGSPLGKQAAEYINRGALVPDEVIVDLVGERLQEKDCEKGFILDGFPRTIPQAQSLDAILERLGIRLNGVLSVQVPDELIVERLSGRRTCRNCGALYHRQFSPSGAENICDRCGGELYQREDDREDTIKARLAVYERQTAPLIDYYQKRALLRQVDGVGSVAEIRQRVARAVEEAAQ